MKYKLKKVHSTILAALILSALPLTACNSGSSSSPPPPSQLSPQTYNVMGLPEFKDIPYLNAMLQVITSDKQLREEVIINNSSPILNHFFHAYDNRNQADLNHLHKHISNLARQTSYSSPIELLAKNDNSYYNNFNKFSLGLELGNIQNYNSGSNVRTYYIKPTYDYSLEGRFKDLPNSISINSFVYRQGEDYYSYLYKNNQWYKIKDLLVSTVTQEEINILPRSKDSDFVIVVYR